MGLLSQSDGTRFYSEPQNLKIYRKCLGEEQRVTKEVCGEEEDVNEVLNLWCRRRKLAGER